MRERGPTGRRLAAVAASARAVAGAALAGAPAGGAAEDPYPQRLARALASDPVYVDQRANPGISTADAGRLRLRVLRRDLGRIKIAVVPDGVAENHGGASGLAHATDRRLRARGVLVIVGSSKTNTHIYAVTSYENSSPTVNAIDEAFTRHENDLSRALLSAVDGIAAVDPGPGADLNQGSRTPPNFQVPDLTHSVDEAFDTARLIGLIVAIAVALPFVAVTILLFVRYRRRRKEAKEEFGDDRTDARNQLIALGDEIRALEIDASMPGVTANTVADYEAAVSQYDRANTALEAADSPHRLAEANAAIAEGMRRIEAIKTRLAALRQ